MAYIATIKVLVDEANKAVVYDGINELLRNSKYGVQNSEDADWIVDWKFESVDPANESLNDSIANETYEEGDAFKKWVIYSPNEAAIQSGAGFWSNEYGWVELDLATKFDSKNTGPLPMSTGNDAVWMLAPCGLNFYRLMLVEYPDDATLDQTPIAFECWAENHQHAVEQAENAYPGCRVLDAKELG